MKPLIVVAAAVLLGTALSCYLPLQGICQQPVNDKTEEKSIWSIGFYAGTSPFHLSPAPGACNPVFTAKKVTDLKVDIVAHPFLVVTDTLYYMFFTAKDGKTDKGGIALAESKDGTDWKYRQVVIKEPFVLAYPYVFKWQGDYYMIPEAHTEVSVRLYKAINFPDVWKFEGEILSGEKFFAVTVFRHINMWWMFTIRPGNETLRLFYASDLKGKWTEHPKSPVVEKDLNTARPAGRPFEVNGKLYRLGMDCHPAYGEQVHAFEITELTTKNYSESMVTVPLVKSSSKGWNAEAMHHVDVHQTGKDQWKAIVDALGKSNTDPLQ